MSPEKMSPEKQASEKQIWLPPRQRAVAILAADGMDTKEIMQTLGMAHGTVMNTKQIVYSKLGIKGATGSSSQQAQLTKRAIREGWIKP